MTRVWIAAGIVAAIISLAVVEFRLAVNTSDEILEIVEETEISAKSSHKNMDGLCREIKDLWDSRKTTLAMFLSHEEISDIDISIDKISRMSMQKKYDEIYIECGILQSNIEGLKETEFVNLHNIL